MPATGRTEAVGLTGARPDASALYGVDLGHPGRRGRSRVVPCGRIGGDA